MYVWQSKISNVSLKGNYDGQTDGQKDKQTDGQIDGQKKKHFLETPCT